MNSFIGCLLTVSLAAASPAAAEELSLKNALTRAEENSPLLKSARLQEQAAHSGVAVARAGYLPSIALDGIDSWGFPGSSGYLGLGGLVASPYRSGAGADVAARQTLFDFGRTSSAVRSARDLERLQHEGIAVDKFSVDLDMLDTFYECSRFRSEREVWDGLHGETELVAKEVARFVSTGQRSLVDRYLADAQVEEARTYRNYFGSRMASTIGRLALLMGVSEGGLTCPALPSPPAEEGSPEAESANPYVAVSEARVEAAKTRLFQAKTDFFPKIVGVASVGTMDKARLVDRADYSGGLGIVVPLFDGLGTVSRLRQARQELEAQNEELGAVRLDMRERDAKYGEIIAASRARIEHLQREEKLAQEGFAVAKNRYLKFQGTLVDLRDALRNLGRIEVEMEDTRADLLEALGSKALLDGAVPAEIQ